MIYVDFYVKDEAVGSYDQETQPGRDFGQQAAKLAKLWAEDNDLALADVEWTFVVKEETLIAGTMGRMRATSD